MSIFPTLPGTACLRAGLRADAAAARLRLAAGLEALIDRKSFYRLADLGVQARHSGDDWFGFWSGGQFFPAIPASEMP